jgi:thiol:disulfide interchange protein DsbD
MSRNRILALASLTAIALALVPSVLPTGPSASLDAKGLLDEGRFLFAAGAVFLGGLLTSLTPCVYPLIPITVGVFGARQAASRGRAFVLTTAYVVGMGAVFSALGVAAGLSGKAFGSAMGNPWLVLAVAGFLVALAASMFGAFELALPSGIALRLNGVGGGGVLGALLMGSVAGLLAAPCTGPVLAGVLAWVSRSQDPVMGAGLLFIYALGIGVPFFVIGVFTVRLPKGGAWMEWVKSFFGIVLLALAATYVRDAFAEPREALRTLAAELGTGGAVGLSALGAFAGVLLGAIHLSFKQPGQWLPKGLGVALLVGAFLVRVGAGGTSGAQPGDEAVRGLSWALKFNPDVAKSLDSFEAVLAQAKHDCRPVMIDFFAEWCAACKELDAHTYAAGDVAAESRRFVNIKVDGTNDNEVLDTLYERFRVLGLPTVVFLDGEGHVLDAPRVSGFRSPEKFLEDQQAVATRSCSGGR